MKRWCILFILIYLISSCAGIPDPGTAEEEQIRSEIETGALGTVFLVDDFDEQYDESALGDFWWTYADSAGSILELNLDENISFSGRSMRMDYTIASSPDGNNTYAGAEMGFESGPDVQGSVGIAFRIKASAAGLPYYYVAYNQDPTQTSPFSLYSSPFQVPLMTSVESVDGFVEVLLPWSRMQRSFWPGPGGTETFRPEKITSMEFAFENTSPEGQQGTIWIDDVRIIGPAPEISEEGSEGPQIFVSQTGFQPEEHKTVLTRIQADQFELLRDGIPVLEGSLEFLGTDTDTEYTLWGGDFTEWGEPGMYTIRVKDRESFTFEIDEEIHSEPLDLAIRAFYLQRSGIDVMDESLEINSPAGHLEPAVLWGDREASVDVRGGWYDAGDYGRYIPTAAFTVHQLLLAWEQGRDAVSSDTRGIPESGNGTPDLLDEIRYELEWMIRMQRGDGGVYHKVTTREYPPTVLPALDTETLFLFGPTSVDSALFAASLARAAVVFADFDPVFSDDLSARSLAAWEWVQKHPAAGFENPPASQYPMQGGYDLAHADFDRGEAINSIYLWAAGELFALTGEERFESAFSEYLPLANPERRFRSMSWADAYNMGLYAYLSSSDGENSLLAEVRERFIAQADRIVEVSNASLFGTALSGRTGDFAYVWSSHQVVCANGLLLMLASDLVDHTRYEEAAYRQIQYLLGLNGLEICFMTGLGSRSVENPHHNMSMALGRAVPGLVGEGPNGQNGDSSSVESGLRALWREDTPPALCYYDSARSYATNEPTIDTNGSFVALLAAWVGEKE